jgi:succinoglycan biosynthesis protein ExoO
MPVAARISRLFDAIAPKSGMLDPRAVCVLSRQRLIGCTNGSSAYLIALCQSLRLAGFLPHLVEPSPAVFGRWPAMAFKPEMRTFETISIRGSIRVGPFLICTDPRVLVAAVIYALSRVLRRAGVPVRFTTPAPAPYAIAAPWQAEDLVFIARHARAVSNVLVTDYAFQNEAAIYTLRHRPIFVVMHDLFHRRTEQFEAAGAVDGVAALGCDEEMALLDLADVVVAIQADEAADVRARLPGKRVIVAPMGVEPVPAAQPGAGPELLFVGSNNATNVAGLHWFFADIWPLIRASTPGVHLTVVGNVSRAFQEAPPGVSFIGVVRSLEAAYSRAAVVVSPLTAGSGLKVKLVEALAHGKAVVATCVTLQGVEEMVAPAVSLASTPKAFAEAVTALLGDSEQRRRMGELGLDLVRSQFGPDATSSTFVNELRQELAAGQALRVTDAKSRVTMQDA